MPKRLVLIAVILIGVISLIWSVDRGPKLLDLDEAAWVFNGYYLDLYLSGDWKNPDWVAFDKYAQHPPAANYVFGALLHAIGEPMKDMEPRRFWFEHDLEIILSPGQFISGVMKRLSMRQVVACRFMAAAFACLAAGTVFLFASRLFGPLAGVVSFLLLILHPLFRHVATLATADTFFIFLTVLTVWLSFELATRKSWILASLLSLVLGVSFGTKIVSFANVGAVAIVMAFMSRSKRDWFTSAIFVLVAVFGSLAIAYLLDPGLSGAPLAQTLSRIAWRQDRIGIQQIVFVSQRIASWTGRLSFALYFEFFSEIVGVIIFLLTTSCVARCLSASPERRKCVLVTILATYFFGLTLLTLPMSWVRYVAQYLPFAVLPAGAGAVLIFDIVKKWSGFSKPGRIYRLVVALGVVTITPLLQIVLSPKGVHMPPPPTEQEVRIAKMFAFSLTHPGEDQAVHKYLYEYFKGKGEDKRAEEQLNFYRK